MTLRVQPGHIAASFLMGTRSASKFGTDMAPAGAPKRFGERYTLIPPTPSRPSTERTMNMSAQMLSMFCPSAKPSMTMPSEIGARPASASAAEPPSSGCVSSTKSPAGPSRGTCGDIGRAGDPGAVNPFETRPFGVFGASSSTKSSPKRPPSMPSRIMRVK